MPQWNPFRIQLPQFGEIWGALGSFGGNTRILLDLGCSGEPWGALGRVPQWNPFRIQLPQFGEIWGALGSSGEPLLGQIP
jgi:hypothetical protein